MAHTDLFHPSVAAARRRIGRGDIGGFTGMRVFYSTPVTLWTTDPGHFAHRLPGGSIGETGPHVVYLARSFIGSIRDVRVRGRKCLPQYPWSPFEDYRLDLMGDHATCSAALTYTSRHSAYLVELWGTDGLLKIDMQSKTLVNYDRVNQSPVGIAFPPSEKPPRSPQAPSPTVSAIPRAASGIPTTASSGSSSSDAPTGSLQPPRLKTVSKRCA